MNAARAPPVDGWTHNQTKTQKLQVCTTREKFSYSKRSSPRRALAAKSRACRDHMAAAATITTANDTRSVKNDIQGTATSMNSVVETQQTTQRTPSDSGMIVFSRSGVRATW